MKIWEAIWSNQKWGETNNIKIRIMRANVGTDITLFRGLHFSVALLMTKSTRILNPTHLAPTDSYARVPYARMGNQRTRKFFSVSSTTASYLLLTGWLAVRQKLHRAYTISCWFEWTLIHLFWNQRSFQNHCLYEQEQLQYNRQQSVGKELV